MKRLFLIGICSLSVVYGLSSCKNEAKLEGTWLEPVPENG